MRQLRAFFAAHPRFTTGVHVSLAVLPSAMALICLLGVACLMLNISEPVSTVVFLLIIIVGYISFCANGGILLLSLLLYFFTHAVRENWPEWLRMTLIRFNIISGFICVVQLLILIAELVK